MSIKVSTNLTSVQTTKVGNPSGAKGASNPIKPQVVSQIAQGTIKSVPPLTSKKDQGITQSVSEKGGSHANAKRTSIDTSVEVVALTSPVYRANIPSITEVLKSDHLSALLKGDAPAKQQNLSAFLKELNAALKNNGLSKEELAVVKNLVQKCHDLAQESSDPIVKQALNESIDLVKSHIFIQSPMFQNMLNYKPGLLKGKDPKMVANELENYAKQLHTLSNAFPSLVSEGDFLKIYENMKTVQKEFAWEHTSFNSAIHMMQEIPAVKNGIFKHFQRGLKNLKLASPTLGKEIDALKAWLKEIYPADHPELLKALSCLDALKSQRILGLNENEAHWMELIKSKHPKLKDKSYNSFIDEAVSQSQKKLLQAMKQTCISLDEMTFAYQQIPDLKKEALQFIFKSFLDANEVKYNHLVERLPILIDIFEKFSSEVDKAFSEKWEKIEKELDKKTAGKFSSVARNIKATHFNEEAKAVLRAEVRTEILAKLSVAKIDADSAFDQLILGALKETSADLPKIFDNAYSLLFKGPHMWVAENINQIESVYDQSIDSNRNMSGGTCLHNSFNRVGKLLTNPSLSGKELPVGSTEKDRYFRGKIQMLDKYFHSENTFEAQFEALSDYGIKESRSIAFTEEGEGASSLMMQDVFSWAKKKQETQLILIFNSPNHALNIQIDEQAGVFRFFDDNTLRTFSYPSESAFRTEFTKYLKAFYPQATRFQVRAYKQLK